VIDSHTHLDHLPEAVDDAVAAAREAGIIRMLTVGTQPGSWEAALAAAENHGDVWAAVGMHPNSAGDFDSAASGLLERLAVHPRCAAIGETGLDYYRHGAPREDQLRAFRAHAELARRAGKPLVVHTRDADQDTLDLLEAFAGGLRVVLHCFSMPDRVEECVERGYWLSFAGNVTYPRNQALAAAVERVPPDRLLVETDAPYLSPQPVRKLSNTPAHVLHTASFVAERRGMTYDELEAAVEENAARLFGW